MLEYVDFCFEELGCVLDCILFWFIIGYFFEDINDVRFF